MVVEMVPLKGGIGGIVHPPIGSIYHLYTTYIPCRTWGVKNATYHLLGEPFQQPLSFFSDATISKSHWTLHSPM